MLATTACVSGLHFSSGSSVVSRNSIILRQLKVAALTGWQAKGNEEQEEEEVISSRRRAPSLSGYRVSAKKLVDS